MASLPGWEVIPGVGANPDRPTGRQSVDYRKFEWHAAEGVGCIELDGTPGPAGVRQVIPTIPGRRYQIRFFISAHADLVGVPYSLRVNAGKQGANFTISNPPGTTPQNLPWTEVFFVFRAAEYTTAIDFRSLAAVEARNPDVETFFGANIDNVSVEPLPFSPTLDADVTP